MRFGVRFFLRLLGVFAVLSVPRFSVEVAVAGRPSVVFWGPASASSVCVVFSPVGRVCPSRVVCRVGSRSAAARLLWRFRAARRWWRSVPLVGSGAWVASGLSFPVPGSLRWLASRPVVVAVRGGSVGGRRRSAFVSSVPAGLCPRVRFRRFRG